MNQERDPELAKLFASLGKPSPDDRQVSRWQMAVRQELGIAPARSRRPLVWASQLAAALATGFLLGYLSFGNHDSLSSAKSDSPGATIQYVFAKSE